MKKKLKGGRGYCSHMRWKRTEQIAEAILESINIASMEVNRRAATSRDADVIVLQEHKVAESAMTSMKDEL